VGLALHTGDNWRLKDGGWQEQKVDEARTVHYCATAIVTSTKHPFLYTDFQLSLLLQKMVQDA
jgi:hypothetical protein